MATSGFTKIANELRKSIGSIRKVIAISGQQALKSNFTNGSDYETGEKWQELAESTKKSRRGKGSSQKPLIDTGALRSGISWVIEGNSITWGLPNSLSYGEYHQFGDGVPERRFMGFSYKKKMEMRKMLGKTIGKIIAKHRGNVLKA